MLLDCCPENENNKLPTPVLKIMPSEDVSLLSANKSTPLWRETYELIEKHLYALRTLKSRFFSDVVADAKIYDKLISTSQYELLLASRNDFHMLCDDLNRTRVSFGSAVIGRDNVICIVLADVHEKMEKLMNRIELFKNAQAMDQDDGTADLFEKRVKKLINTILIAIQKLYKKDYPKRVHEEQTEPLKEGHLKELLMKSLQENVDLLNMAEVGREARYLIKLLTKNSSSLRKSRKT